MLVASDATSSDICFEVRFSFFSWIGFFIYDCGGLRNDRRIISNEDFNHSDTNFDFFMERVSLWILHIQTVDSRGQIKHFCLLQFSLSTLKLIWWYILEWMKCFSFIWIYYEITNLFSMTIHISFLIIPNQACFFPYQLTVSYHQLECSFWENIT